MTVNNTFQDTDFELPMVDQIVRMTAPPPMTHSWITSCHLSVVETSDYDMVSFP